MHSRTAVTVFVMLFVIGVFAQGRDENQGTLPGDQGALTGPTFANFTSAIAAANATGNSSATNLTTLIAAVEAAGVVAALNDSTAWTILAPTNKAFETRLREDLNITPAALLDPANNATLIEVLSYHIIPTAAVNSSELVDGQNLTTALAGAAPLQVKLRTGKKPRFVGATNSATVLVPDIQVGGSVIHIVNDVLLPAGVGKGSGKAGKGSNSTDSPEGARRLLAF